MTEQKRRGRPAKPAVEGKRVSLGLKVTPQAKARLDEAARLHGRTQSQEAEFRLELSFHREQLLVESLQLSFGREFAGLLYMLGVVMSRVGFVTANRKAFGETPWIAQPYPYDQAVRAAIKLLESLRPAGDPQAALDGSAAGLYGELLARDFEQGIARLGEGFANHMIRAVIKHPDSREAFKEQAKVIRELLGPVLAQMREPDDHEGEHHPPRKE